MLNKIKFILVFLFLISISFFAFLNIENKKIDNVLKTSSYSYLSEAAKEYIVQVYEKSGEVLLTEKNKEANVPYLNPEYVEYLNYIAGDTVNDELKYDVIPEETLIDYVDNGVVGVSYDLPSKFDLRNVDGKNFVTPVKDQDSTGLCWAFATNAQAESHLLVKNNVSYGENVSQFFSEMQLDYALADDGIIDGVSMYSHNRILGDGGTFNYIAEVAKDGLGFVDTSWKNFDDYDYMPMEKNKIYNYSNSKYDLLSTVNYPRLELGLLDLSVESNVTKRNNYLNNLKKLIMDNGGAYVSTSDPSSRCSISVNGSRLMYDDNKCASSGHALQVIGWDDDFSYSFCSGLKDDKHYYYLGNPSNCAGGTVINGKGAWLLKNSWGASLPYVYLAYDSIGSSFNIITKMDIKNWNNNYKMDYKGNNSSKVVSNYTKENNVLENLSIVKFESTMQNTSYNVCYINAQNKINDCVLVDIPYSGFYSVDFSLKNYVLDNNSKVEITSNSVVGISSLSMYTSNEDDRIEIKTEDVIYENKLTNIDKYIFRLSSTTINVPENSLIDYKILDKDRNEITVKYTYEENIVFANNIFSKLFIDKELSKGEYILQTIYNGNVLCESSLIINKEIVTIEGKGTESDPYIINTPSQLDLVRLDQFAFYKLGQDIDLTYDTSDPNGLFYNGGKGWEPIKYSTYRVVSVNSIKQLYFSEGFSGGFDGNNYKIIGLNINRPDEDGVGLFANTYNRNFANLYIKNIILDAPTIIGRNWVGSLIGYMNGTTYERILDISNVQVIGGHVKGNDYVGGIIGHLNAGSHLKKIGTSNYRHNISNLYNSATVDASHYGGGIVGMVTTISGYGQDKSPINIFNVLNKGTVMSSGNTGGIVGFVMARDINNINIYDSMNTGMVVGDTVASNILGEYSSNSNGTLNLSNIYYLNDEQNDFININVSNVSKKSIDELKKVENYSLWKSFNNSWKIEEINEITRLPVLKFIKFEYLSIDNINIEIDKSVNVKDYINPLIDAALYNDYEIEDTSIAKIDSKGKITGLKVGSTVMHVNSYYDGSKFDVLINISGDKKITFESNGGNAVTSITGGIGSAVIEPEIPVRGGYIFVGWYLDNETFKNKYEFGAMPESDIILYAMWNEMNVSIKNYDIYENMIVNIKPNTFIKDYLNYFDYNSKIKFNFYNRNNLLEEDFNVVVGTMSKIKFYDNSKVVAEYINVVSGDVDGDGQLTLQDIMKVARYVYINNDNLVDGYLLAADYNGDNKYNLQDIMKMAFDLYKK